MQVEVEIAQLRQFMSQALRLRSIGDDDAEFMIDDFIESELEGHKTHGISKFLTIDAGISQRKEPLTVVTNSSCFAKIDGHRELGHIVARRAASMCVDMAKKHGVGIVGFGNISRYSRVTPYARLIAQAGLVGILTNNGGPACVAPFGGRTAIFGTNPLCFGFPSQTDRPFIFDFATSQKVWGAVRQAIVEQAPLPDGCFVDEHGNYTTDPQQAQAVVPFGGPKGYALCYALEIMTGAFVGAKMGCDTQDEYDLGYLFAALSPEMFSDGAAFTAQVEQLAAQVRQCPPMQSGAAVYVPGEIFGETLSCQRNRRTTMVEEDVYARLKQMSVCLSGGYENNKKMN